MKKNSKRLLCMLIMVFSIMTSASAQRLLYQGSFTGVGTKAMVKTGQIVMIPKVSAYAQIYTDRIVITANGTTFTLNFWKMYNECYCYGNDNYSWMFLPNTMTISEASQESIIQLNRTCQLCNGGGYCGTCGGGGMVVNPYSSTGTSLCGACGGGGRCSYCNGNGWI